MLRQPTSAKPTYTLFPYTTRVRSVMSTGADTGVDSLPPAEYASEESMEILLSLAGASTAEVSRFAITRSARDILRHSAKTAEDRFGTPGDTLRRFEKLLPDRKSTRLNSSH